MPAALHDAAPSPCPLCCLAVLPGVRVRCDAGCMCTCCWLGGLPVPTVLCRSALSAQSFEKLRQLTIFGASEDKGTRRCLTLLARAMPWVLIDV